MAKKRTIKEHSNEVIEKASIMGAGKIVDMPITQTLEKNYMPYAMSVIVSRAIPEIDGFKPSHRKLLYTMYKMGLLTGPLTKSANIVGQTMRLNPHGDNAIYETMVRLTRANQSMLHPFVESKGSFGKVYSRDMAYAASRYTEAKLASISKEIFTDIDKDTVDFQDNYDGTTKEPGLLPVSFPTVLVNATTGIAVGMASSICPFNLNEVCDTTIGLMDDDNFDIMSTLKAPDFPCGGIVITPEEELKAIYETGRGAVRVRGKYSYDKIGNRIEIYEIPYTTTIEAIVDKVVENVKLGKIREITDVRDESDKGGLRIAFDLKKGEDPHMFIHKLYKLTPLEDTFSCNFNILVAGTPRVMGVREILTEWIAFRTDSVRRGVFFDLTKKKERLHLLKGLEKLLLNIDKAIKIIRETDEEKEVVPNLMIGFGIDQIQAEYIAEIKLRHLNREYILSRTAEISELLSQIEDMESIVASPKKIKKIISEQLKDVKKKYGQPRKTDIDTDVQTVVIPQFDEIPDYPINLFFTKEGYFKKITPQSLRMSSDHKLKENDEIVQSIETTNRAQIVFLTDKGQAYKAQASEFDNTKASLMGDFISAKLGMDQGENPVFFFATTDFSEDLTIFFKNGKGVRIPTLGFETKTKRKKLTNSMNTASEFVCAFCHKDPMLLMLRSSLMRVLIVDTAQIPQKTSRSAAGVQVMTLKKNAKLEEVKILEENMLSDVHRYRTKNIPAAGATLSAEDVGEQLEL